MIAEVICALICIICAVLCLFCVFVRADDGCTRDAQNFEAIQTEEKINAAAQKERHFMSNFYNYSGDEMPKFDDEN